VLTITGTNNADFIRGFITNNVLTMRLNGLSQTFNNASSISRIVVNANGGNDLILLSQSVNRPTSLNGGDGNDTIYGGSGADVINGGNGTDVATRGPGDTLTLVEEILA
jgi:Ca2+-binding RTX toxin-like protein